jgi:hypothetical protein
MITIRFTVYGKDYTEITERAKATANAYQPGLGDSDSINFSVDVRPALESTAGGVELWEADVTITGEAGA